MTSSAHYPSLRGRRVLITGGATGIGATLVEQFARQEARVGFIDIATAAGEMLAHQFPDTSFVTTDLTDVDQLRTAIGQLRERLGGPFGVLINNAANDARHALDSVTSESWDAGIAVNLKHQFFAAQAVIDDMKTLGGGSIINFGSMSWKAKQGGMPTYTTSKAAIQGLTRSLARDLGPYNIRVNTLVPGWVMTEKQLTQHVNATAKEEIARNQCINRPLMPSHIAAMALFLAADDSELCTAQDFIVDAGWL